MIYVFLSALTGALFSLGYKMRSRFGLDFRGLLVLQGLFTSLLACGGVLAFGQPLFSLTALALGLPFGASACLAMYLYFLVVQEIKLNVSWMVIQLSLVIPFLLSVALYNEGIQTFELVGVGLALTAILIFGLGKPDGRRGAASAVQPPVKRRALLWLAVSAVLSGTNQFLPKVFRETGQGGAFALLMYGGLGLLAAAFFALPREAKRLDPDEPGKRSRAGWALPAVSAYMAVFQFLVNLFLLLALETVKGSVVYPVRSVTNVLAVTGLSFVFFGETLTALEALAMAAAIGAIVFISL
jgi:drug/metabolite transporter (DMT)-like permease